METTTANAMATRLANLITYYNTTFDDLAAKTDKELLRLEFMGKKTLAQLRRVQTAPLKIRHQWQPIETAPRDGSWFIAVSSWNKYAVSCYQWDGYNFMTEFEIAMPKDVYTHWQPLPEPPNDTTREG